MGMNYGDGIRCGALAVLTLSAIWFGATVGDEAASGPSTVGQPVGYELENAARDVDDFDREKVRAHLVTLLQQTRSSTETPRRKPELIEALNNEDARRSIGLIFYQRLEGPYSRLFKKLELDEASLEKFMGLLVEKELSTLEAAELATRLDIGDQQGIVRVVRNELDKEISALIGEDAFSQYKNYEQTLSFRNHADRLEKRLSYTSQPLTESEYERLVDVLAKTGDQNVTGGAGAYLGRYAPSISDEFLIAAKNVLKPAQFEVYAKMNEDRKLSERMAAKYEKGLRASRKKRGEGL